VRRLFITLLAVLAVIAAGCGGGGDRTDKTDNPAGSSLSKAEFLKQGNAICVEGNEELDEAFEERNISKSKPQTEKQRAKVAEEIILPVISEEVERIRRLGTPSGEGRKVDEILSTIEAGIEEAEEDPTLLAEPTGGPFVWANEMTREYGLVSCGEE
jgi:hypothetical protein